MAKCWRCNINKPTLTTSIGKKICSYCFKTAYFKCASCERIRVRRNRITIATSSNINSYLNEPRNVLIQRLELRNKDVCVTCAKHMAIECPKCKKLVGKRFMMERSGRKADVCTSCWVKEEVLIPQNPDVRSTEPIKKKFFSKWLT